MLWQCCPEGKGGPRGARGCGLHLSIPWMSANNFVWCSEANSSQRLPKLLQGRSTGKSKQARRSGQHLAASAAITPAMRQHATARISQALVGNSALNFDTPRAEEEDEEEASAEAGASRWESRIYQGSSSKSAYLSKLANAVSQIKRASNLSQLDLPSTLPEPNQARQLGKTAQNVSQTRDQSSQCAEMPDKTQQDDPQAHAGTFAGQHQSAKTSTACHENELQSLMHLLSGES